MIAAAFPDLAQRGLRPLGRGWANACWLAGEDVVVRVPQTPAGKRALRKEIALMPALSAALPLAAPDFFRAAADGSVAAYHRVPGASRAALLPSDAAAVADLLTALHTFRPDGVPLPGGGPRAWWVEHAALVAAVAPALTAAEADAVRRHVEVARHFAFTPVLIHGDLVPDHLLAAGELTGVIDFEDAALGDPALDFAGVGDLAPAVLARYRGPADPGILARAAFYRSLAPLHQIRYGLEAGRPEHVAAGRQLLRRQASPGACVECTVGLKTRADEVRGSDCHRYG